jgi:hypothetical protein
MNYYLLTKVCGLYRVENYFHDKMHAMGVMELRHKDAFPCTMIESKLNRVPLHIVDLEANGNQMTMVFDVDQRDGFIKFGRTVPEHIGVFEAIESLFRIIETDEA